MSEKDAREYPLRPDEKALQQERERREVLANRFHACFTEYPEVLQEIRRMAGEGGSLLWWTPGKEFDRDLTLVHIGGRELLALIDGMVTAGRLGTEERTPTGPLQRSTGQP